MVSGLLVGGGYATYKIAQYKLNEWTEHRAREMAQRSKKEYHFDSNQRTCNMTLLSFLPTLRNNIAESCDSDSLIAALKLSPSNKVELWEQLKVLSFARALSSILSTTCLFVYLRVQMNVVAGYMFVEGYRIEETIDENDSPPESDSLIASTREKYLNTVKFLLDAGCNNLIGDVERAVREHMQGRGLSEKLSHQDLRVLLFDVLNDVTTVASGLRQSKHAFCKYMVPGEESQPSEDDLTVDQMNFFNKLMGETIDILEGNDCREVIDTCINGMVTQLLDEIKGKFQSNEEDPDAIMTSDFQEVQYKQLSLPLAKIIPSVNSQMHEIFKAGANAYLDDLMANGLVRNFSANLYEAFSCHDNHNR